MVQNSLDSFEPLETENASVYQRIVAAKDVDKRDKIVTLIDLVAAGIETVQDDPRLNSYEILVMKSHFPSRLVTLLSSCCTTF